MHSVIVQIKKSNNSLFALNELYILNHQLLAYSLTANVNYSVNEFQTIIIPFEEIGNRIIDSVEVTFEWKDDRLIKNILSDFNNWHKEYNLYIAGNRSWEKFNVL